MSLTPPQIPQRYITPDQVDQDVRATLSTATESLQRALCKIHLLREQQTELVARNAQYEQELHTLRAQLQQQRGPRKEQEQVRTPLTTSDGTAVAVGTPIPTSTISNGQGAEVSHLITTETTSTISEGIAPPNVAVAPPPHASPVISSLLPRPAPHTFSAAEIAAEPLQNIASNNNNF